MKRIITAILAIVYLSASTGATIHQHYCMGKLANWGLGYDQISECGKCGMDEGAINDTGCCKDEHTFIKNEDDQKTAESLFHFAGYGSIATAAHDADLYSINVSFVREESFSDNSPPRLNGVAVYLFKKTFLI